MFEYVQGHDNAAGCAIQDSLLTHFHNWANEKLKNYNLGENSFNINFDRIAANEDIRNLIIDIGAHENIWGQNNPQPLIRISDINITKNDIKIMGKNMDTVKIEKFGIAYMKFHAKDLIEDLKKYSKVKLEIVGRANVNYWGGNVIPQIFIDDYEVTDDALGF